MTKFYASRAECIKNLLVHFGLRLNELPNDFADFTTWSKALSAYLNTIKTNRGYLKFPDVMFSIPHSIMQIKDYNQILTFASKTADEYQRMFSLLISQKTRMLK